MNEQVAVIFLCLLLYVFQPKLQQNSNPFYKFIFSTSTRMNHMATTRVQKMNKQKSDTNYDNPLGTNTTQLCKLGQCEQANSPGFRPKEWGRVFSDSSMGPNFFYK